MMKNPLEKAEQAAAFLRERVPSPVQVGLLTGTGLGDAGSGLNVAAAFDYAAIPPPTTGFSITCGVLGMSHIFDAVVSGSSEAEAVAKFVRGIALNAHRFAHEPEEVFLSGGLCANPLFVLKVLFSMTVL